MSVEKRVRSAVEKEWHFVGRLLRHLGVRVDLEDAIQLVFITFAEKIRLVEVGKERAFLAGTSVHIAARARRSLAREQSRRGGELDEDAGGVEVSDSRGNPERIALAKSELSEFDRRMATLGEDLGAVFLMYEVEEMTMREIAEALDLPPGTVASRLRRARELFSGRAEAGAARQREEQESD